MKNLISFFEKVKRVYQDGAISSHVLQLEDMGNSHLKMSIKEFKEKAKKISPMIPYVDWYVKNELLLVISHCVEGQRSYEIYQSID